MTTPAVTQREYPIPAWVVVGATAVAYTPGRLDDDARTKKVTIEKITRHRVVTDGDQWYRRDLSRVRVGGSALFEYTARLLPPDDPRVIRIALVQRVRRALYRLHTAIHDNRLSTSPVDVVDLLAQVQRIHDAANAAYHTLTDVAAEGAPDCGQHLGRFVQAGPVTRPYCDGGTCGRTSHGPHVPHPLVQLADENHWDIECDQRPHCTTPAHHSIDGGES